MESEAEWNLSQKTPYGNGVPHTPEDWAAESI
jgi:hypothetical protein